MLVQKKSPFFPDLCIHQSYLKVVLNILLFFKWTKFVNEKQSSPLSDFRLSEIILVVLGMLVPKFGFTPSCDCSVLSSLISGLNDFFSFLTQ